MKFPLLGLSALLLCGCASKAPVTHGLPNFGVVDASKGIYRGGEPTAEGWQYLKGALRVTDVVKLNTEKEGSEAEGENLGLNIHRYPITTEQQIFGNDLSEIIPKAAGSITSNTYVHCTFGKNRTGTVVGYYRVLSGWDKATTQAEMDKYGWGDSLPGLKAFWRRVEPDQISKQFEANWLRTNTVPLKRY